MPLRLGIHLLRDDTLLPEVGGDGEEEEEEEEVSGSSNQSNTMINSRVISASLNGQRVLNLSQPVVITFLPLEVKATYVNPLIPLHSCPTQLISSINWPKLNVCPVRVPRKCTETHKINLGIFYLEGYAHTYLPICHFL